MHGNHGAMIPLLAEDGSISNDLFKYIAGALALTVIGLAGYIVKLHATARSDMLANLPVLTLAREMLESVKETMAAMTARMEAMTAKVDAMASEMKELREVVQHCGLK